MTDSEGDDEQTEDDPNDMIGERNWGLQDAQTRVGKVPWLVIAAVLAVSVATAAAGLYLGTPDDRTLRAFLGTLATVQSGVLAIVFSVALVAIQLTTRYSSRIGPLYTRSPALRFTFFVFVVSVGLDVVLLFNMPLNGTVWYRGWVYFAGGLAAGAAITLYEFVRRLTATATPEGMVRLFEQDLDTETYLGQVQEFDAGDRETHPLRPLHTMAMAAVSEHDTAAAETALSKERELAIQHHRSLSEEGRLGNLDRSVKRKQMKPVVADHFHNFLFHADERDEYSLMRQTIEAQREIGAYGIEVGDEAVARTVIQALRGQARKADPSEQTAVQRVIWNEAGELLKEAAAHSQTEAVREATRGFRNALAGQVSGNMTDERLDDVTREAFNSLQTSLSLHLKANGPVIGDAERDWARTAVEDGNESIEIAQHLLSAYREITGAVVRGQKNHDESSIDPAHVLGHWRELCTKAAEEAGGEFTTATCRLLIELVLIYGEGERFLVRVASETPEHVESAFDQILQYEPRDPDSEKPDPWLYKVDGEYYRSGINTQRPPLNVRDDYPECVETLRETVMEQAEYQDESTAE